MNAFLHLSQYLAEFISEREKFQIKVINKVKTYFMFKTFFPKTVPFMR